MGKNPYFIAEISSNHCGNFDRAKELILSAKKFKADAVKLQTFTPSSMTFNSKNKIFRIKSGLWKGHNYWDLYKKAQTPLSWHKKLFEFSRKNGITIFSSPFDDKSVDFLENLNCPFYKVASFEMTDFPLVKKIAQTNKPMIISTGMATLKEIYRSYNYAKKNGAKKITLLYCVSNYPAKNSDFNLNNIQILKKEFNCTVGFSDHSLNNQIAYSAIAAGAEVIEKHIALENQIDGFDIKFSLRGNEIDKFRKGINQVSKLMGKNFFWRSPDEKKNKVFRRSIYAIKKIKKNEKFTKKNIKVLRPNHGLEPYYYDLIIGTKSPYNLNKAEPLKRNFIKKLSIKDLS